MNKLYTFLLVLTGLFVSQISSAQQRLQDEMLEVNAFWQNRFGEQDNQTVHFNSDIERIQMHLYLIEKALRKVSVEHLNVQQVHNRKLMLDVLKKYADKGVFPINNGHLKRTPYFIDHRGVACAVGYLMIQSGQARLAEIIKKEDNNAYIFDLNQKYSEIEPWADEMGFELEELAWIQPGYPFEPNLCKYECYEGFKIFVFGNEPDKYQYLWYHIDSNRYTYSQQLPIACPGNTYKAYALTLDGDTVDSDQIRLELGWGLYSYVKGDLLHIPSAAPLKTQTISTPANEGCNGSIKINLISGTPPLQSWWKGGWSIKDGGFENLCADTYIISTRDSNQCWVIDTVEIKGSTRDSSFEKDAFIFRNPFSGFLKIQVDSAKWVNAKVEILNSTGKVEMLTHTTGQELQLDVRWLTSGTYFLIVTKGESIYRRKILID